MSRRWRARLAAGVKAEYGRSAVIRARQLGGSPVRLGTVVANTAGQDIGPGDKLFAVSTRAAS